MTTVMEACSSATRGCVIAPKGKKLVVADLSNIEGRKLAWLAGEEWKLQAFRDFDTVIGWDDKKQKPIRKGFDLYILAYAKAFGCSPEDVDDFMRQIGKTMELALGYAGGVGAFITFSLAFNIDLELMAKNAWDAIPEAMRREARDFMEWHISQGKSTYGLSEEAFIVCESFKRLWREAHPQTVSYWKELGAACITAVNNPGRTYTCRRHKIRRDGAWLRVMLPSGRYLCYPSPRVDDDQLTYMGINQYSRKWERLRTYGGKLVENCIAEGTEVLTEKFGWLAIERVSPNSRVWDGDEWVSFSHCVYKGKEPILTAFGVEMTSDHLVLTDEGWKNASSCERYNRAACRLPHGYTLHGFGRQEDRLGSSLRLRQDDPFTGLGIKSSGSPWHHRILRLHASDNFRTQENQAWHECTSSVCGVEINERSLPPPYASGVSQLWRTRYQGLRTLARKVRELLGGYGARLSSRFNYRTPGQFIGLLQRELRLAHGNTPSQQPADESFSRNTARAHDSFRSCSVLWDTSSDTSRSSTKGNADRTGADTRRVYDLVNCGPRSRFVVRGSDGLPLIVHNCCQASARDVLAYRMPDIEKAGYEIVLTVHDEIISEAPDTDEYTHEHLAELMSAGCDWTEGLPLAAAGFEAYRYRKG